MLDISHGSDDTFALQGFERALQHFGMAVEPFADMLGPYSICTRGVNGRKDEVLIARETGVAVRTSQVPILSIQVL